MSNDNKMEVDSTGPNQNENTVPDFQPTPTNPSGPTQNQNTVPEFTPQPANVDQPTEPRVASNPFDGMPGFKSGTNPQVQETPQVRLPPSTPMSGKQDEAVPDPWARKPEKTMANAALAEPTSWKGFTVCQSCKHDYANDPKGVPEVCQQCGLSNPTNPTPWNVKTWMSQNQQEMQNLAAQSEGIYKRMYCIRELMQANQVNLTELEITPKTPAEGNVSVPPNVVLPPTPKFEPPNTAPLQKFVPF